MADICGLREAIAWLTVYERELAADTGKTYAVWICPNEAKIGVTFVTPPWTDEEEWGRMCPP